MKAKDLVKRINLFGDNWISNPAAKLQFAKLIRDVHELPRSDHANQDLLEWVDEELATAKRLGIR
jgi:hypothetical protein